MVFVVSTSEHTTKVVLSTRTRSGGTEDQPKFILRTPIVTPHQMVSSVCMESIIVDAPSLFQAMYIDDVDNRFTVTQNGVDVECFTATHPDINFTSMQALLNNFKDIDLTNNIDLARFYVQLASAFPVLKIIFPTTDAVANTSIEFVSDNANPPVYTFHFWKNGVLQAGVDTADEVVTALLPILPGCLYNTVYLQTTDTDNEFTIQGPWATLLGLNPRQTYTFGGQNDVKLPIHVRTTGTICSTCMEISAEVCTVLLTTIRTITT